MVVRRSTPLFSSNTVMRRTTPRFSKVKAKGVKVFRSLSRSDVVTTAFSDLKAMFTRTVTDTTLMLSLLLSLWLQYQHSVNSSSISSYVKLHSSDKVSAWVSANIERLLGFSSFLPVFAAANSKIRTPIIGFSAAVIWLVPVLKQPDYVLAAFCLLLYIECTRKSTRLVFVAMLVGYFYLLDKGGMLTRIVRDAADPESSEHRGFRSTATVADLPPMSHLANGKRG